MTDIRLTFERELDAILHDATFAGVEIVAQHARMRGATTALVVTIDRPEGVDVGLCERIAERLNAKLDACGGNYSLEVESAGLERPLVNPADYVRFTGKPVRVVTKLVVNGAKTHRGTLLGLRGETVVLSTATGELPLPVATIKTANLEYDPRTDLQRAKRQRKNNHG